jgi:hypothetical protein
VVEACTNEEGGGMVAEFYPPTSMAARHWSRGRRESEGEREGLSARPNGAAWLLGFPMHGDKARCTAGHGDHTSGQAPPGELNLPELQS